ncbi:MAG: aminomethyl-transferring glycine dehydrogenase [Planctomycetota bacterium]
MTTSLETLPLAPPAAFADRHLGPSPADVAAMLAVLGLDSLEELVLRTVPAGIRLRQPLALEGPRTESAHLAEMRALAGKNRVLRSCIGLGYHGTIVPPVILRNVLENPGWYTQYTPYQAEVAQGRLEALLVFQTLVSDLTGLPLANASLLDEATAAAEALCMGHRLRGGKQNAFFVSALCHPQTIAVVRTRAEALGIEVVVGDHASFAFPGRATCACLVQYPASEGAVLDYTGFTARAHAAGALVVVATDLLALTLLRPPGEFGADVAVGSAQRFGVPMGFGGPHAAFFATRDENRRQVPGRIIGRSRDTRGKPALRMALQTREQHIRREKATSNICTSQVLLAILAAFYGVYHGPAGLRRIGERVHGQTAILAAGLRRLGFALPAAPFFDTLRVDLGSRPAAAALAAAVARGINLRPLGAHAVGVALDETITEEDLDLLLAAFAEVAGARAPARDVLAAEADPALPPPHARESSYLSAPVFHRYHGEHEILRYIRRLESRDLSLTTSMIPLGSCTMKLNATAEMIPITWPELADLHPFAPAEQARGYAALLARLEAALVEITGFPAISLQPNAGSQGEYTGLLVIRAWHASRGEEHRRVCLIPASAHGTNPASAVMAGMRVVPVACDARGNIDLADLRARAAEHAGELAALMVTYPSTHGVFEAGIREVCAIVHQHGGQVYMDGANLNAQVGLCRPADIGADACHLNLHKTFAIPHGGGGPGMGPIAVAAHLAPFRPGHPLVRGGGERAIGPVSAAPYGSPGILAISWGYIALLGPEGLRRASEVAILNANYMAKRLAGQFDILYTGEQGMVAHEFILDLRPFEKSAGVTGEDVAKRLMDYGFHAPTMSFPVAGTLMIEPTESESRAELDRLADALLAIREEIRAIETGALGREDNPLKHAPHPADVACADEWPHAYSRALAAYPAPWTREHKYWPYVSRVDNGYGDRNLVCCL